MRKVQFVYIKLQPGYDTEEILYFKKVFLEALKKVASSTMGSYTINKNTKEYNFVYFNKPISMITVVKIINILEEEGYICKELVYEKFDKENKYYQAKIIVESF